MPQDDPGCYVVVVFKNPFDRVGSSKLVQVIGHLATKLNDNGESAAEHWPITVLVTWRSFVLIRTKVTSVSFADYAIMVIPPV